MEMVADSEYTKNQWIVHQKKEFYHMRIIWIILVYGEEHKTLVLSVLGPQVQSLLGELRSHMPCCEAKKKKKKKNQAKKLRC